MDSRLRGKDNKESTSLIYRISSGGHCFSSSLPLVSRAGGGIYFKRKKYVHIAPMGMTSFFFAKEKDIMNSGNISLKKETIALLID
jgi:hypothetical protein